MTVVNLWDTTEALVSCDHCGIVVAKPREFGWKRWSSTELVIGDHLDAEPVEVEVERHHCPAAAQYNDMLAGGLIHGTDPNDAVVYGEWP